LLIPKGVDNGLGVGTQRERPPDPEKQSPGAAGTATGAKQNSKSTWQPRNTRGTAYPQVVERPWFVITHGHDTAGFIEQEGKSFEALASQGRAFGVFQTLKEACVALSAARGGER
jgi:hypothetical protein